MIEKMGFKKGNIIETVVTTYNDERSPHAAPMGVYTKDKKNIILKIYKKSNTLANIKKRNTFIINIIFDPLIFLKTISVPKKMAQNKNIGEFIFYSGSEVDAPYIKDAAATIEARSENIVYYRKRDLLGDAEVALVTGRIVKENLFHRYPVAPNRGFNWVLELAIEISRGKTENIDKYLKIIKKTSDNKTYNEVKSYLRSRGLIWV